MGTSQRLLWPTFLLLIIAISIASANQDELEQPFLVGHISHIEGEMLRYSPENEDWTVTVKDTPVGKDDLFYADENTKAEFIIPNNTWIRVGGNTQIEIVKLEDDSTVIDMDSGIARFYNKSSTTILQAITPFGYVTAPPLTTCDVYLKDKSVEVIALKGNVDFVHVTDDTEFEVIAGSSSIVAGYQEIKSGKGMADDDWNSWNIKRDALWDSRLEMKGDSTKHLPDGLYHQSYTLEENGIWERVYYEGSYRCFWRPLYVTSCWSPFTVGRWTQWYGDQCWVPYEPFGYVTHHYGNWVYIHTSHCWYWAPPAWCIGIGAGSSPYIGLAWYPGRVSWIHRGAYIGWIPLAPHERYYCRRYWGPRSVVVNNIHTIHVRNHCYKDHPIVIKRRHFYNVDNYNKVRIKHIGTNTIMNSYHGAAIINSRVIKDIKEIKNRFNFKNMDARRKPHRSAAKKTTHGKPDERQFIKSGASVLQPRGAKLKAEKLVESTHIKTQRLSDRIISSRKIHTISKTRTDAKKTPLRPEIKKLKSRIVPKKKVQRLTPKIKGQKSISGVVPKVNIQRLRPNSKAQKSISRLRLVRKNKGGMLNTGSIQSRH